MTLGSHQRSIGKSQVHLTPKWIIDELGPFDLDPCAASPRPWDCATNNLALPEDGLTASWHGLVWLNPPFDSRQIVKWIGKLAFHDNGIALLHARTDTRWFANCWRMASAMLFIHQRVTFHKPDGSLCTTEAGKPSNSGAPVVLVAFGQEAYSRLRACKIPGALVSNWYFLDKDRT